MTPQDQFEWRQTAYGSALICRALEPYASHLFTSREWLLGSSTDGNRADAWGDVPRALGVDDQRLIRAHQVHGATVVLGRRDEASPVPTALPKADILVSDDPARVLAIQTADCVPLLLADRRTGAVAAAHAGWRGLAAGVPKVVVDSMRQALEARVADLVVAIGPSISAARYEVGDEVRETFEQAGFNGDQLARWFLPGTRPGHWQFDGWASAREQLEDAGVPGQQIHASNLCTASDPARLCSYRRDGTRAGRMAAAIRPAMRRP